MGFLFLFLHLSSFLSFLHVLPCTPTSSKQLTPSVPEDAHKQGLTFIHSLTFCSPPTRDASEPRADRGEAGAAPVPAVSPADGQRQPGGSHQPQGVAGRYAWTQPAHHHHLRRLHSPHPSLSAPSEARRAPGGWGWGWVGERGGRGRGGALGGSWVGGHLGVCRS